MDRFPKKHQLPKLTQEEISKSNFLVSTKENKFAVKNILQRKLLAQMASPVNSSRCLRKITLSQTHLENRGDTLNTFLMPTYP